MQGFFQPIAGLPYANSSSGLPRSVELLKSAFKSTDDVAHMTALPRFGHYLEWHYLERHLLLPKLLHSHSARLRLCCQRIQLVDVPIAPCPNSSLYFAGYRLKFIDRLAKNQGSQALQTVDEAWSEYSPCNKITICEGTHEDGAVGMPPLQP